MRINGRAVRLLGTSFVAMSVACGGPACTAVQCTSGVRIVVEPSMAPMLSGAAVTLCVDEQCTTQVLTTNAALVTADFPIASEGARRVHLTVADLDVETDGRFARVSPNGQSCRPVCYISQLTLTQRQGLVPRA